MLVVNLAQALGLVNGSRGVVEKFGEKGYPIVKFTSGASVLIRPYMWKQEFTKTSCVFIAQIPLVIAYALTIHKSQSQSIDRVTLDLGNCFEKGQAYVGLSRVTSLEGMSLVSFNPSVIQADERVTTFYANL